MAERSEPTTVVGWIVGEVVLVVTLAAFIHLFWGANLREALVKPGAYAVILQFMPALWPRRGALITRYRR